MSDGHLSRTELVAWRDDGAGDRARIVEHLATCAPCRAMAAEVERLRPVETALPRADARDFVAQGYRAGGAATRARSLRPWLWPAAAAAVIVLALVPVWQSRFSGEPNTMRGATAPTLVRPVDTTVAIDALVFEWKGEAARVRLNVVDLARADAPVIQRELTGSRYEPTAEERGRFSSGQSLYWFVEAIGGTGGTSPAARFRVQ